MDIVVPYSEQSDSILNQTPRVIGHIIGLDEIHKKKLIKNLSEDIIIIDLDMYQQKIYNDEEITKLKMLWNKTNRDIYVLKNQSKILGSNRMKANNINNKINKLTIKRNKTKNEIYSLWKDKMLHKINEKMKESDKNVLFLGANIFPKDYRQKIDLPIEYLSIENSNKKIFNKIMVEMTNKRYSENQIKFYLHAYEDKIIRGVFPLNLLKMDYLSSKYDKLISYYGNRGYNFVPLDKLSNMINDLNKQLSDREKVMNKSIYVPTIFKAGDMIPVNGRTPIEGFMGKDEAIDHIKSKLKKPTPIYLYEVGANNFHFIDGKLIATQPIESIINEESLILSA